MIAIPLLFLIIGISRISQKWFLEKDRFMNAAVAFGVVYIAIALGLILNLRIANLIVFTLGPILPLMGTVGGLYRYFKYQRKRIVLVHVALDVLLLILFILLFANVFFLEHTQSIPLIVR